jgi:hypothetical protein
MSSGFGYCTSGSNDIQPQHKTEQKNEYITYSAGTDPEEVAYMHLPE